MCDNGEHKQCDNNENFAGGCHVGRSEVVAGKKSKNDNCDDDIYLSSARRKPHTAYGLCFNSLSNSNQITSVTGRIYSLFIQFRVRCNFLLHFSFKISVLVIIIIISVCPSSLRTFTDLPRLEPFYENMWQSKQAGQIKKDKTNKGSIENEAVTYLHHSVTEPRL